MALLQPSAASRLLLRCRGAFASSFSQVLQQAQAAIAEQQVVAAAAAALRQQQPLAQFATVSGEDSHDDFKPQYKGEPASDVQQQIKDDIKGSRVFIYMKGTPEAPQCGFSNMACRVLDAYNIQYGSRNVLADPGIREGIKEFTGWPTIPQVFVEGEFIGGSDILMEMHKAGELEQLAADGTASKSKA